MGLERRGSGIQPGHAVNRHTGGTA
jgi:hypothetical protein